MLAKKIHYTKNKKKSTVVVCIPPKSFTHRKLTNTKSDEKNSNQIKHTNGFPYPYKTGVPSAKLLTKEVHDRSMKILAVKIYFLTTRLIPLKFLNILLTSFSTIVT